jgi:non-specific serine/threonine protein kinase
LTSFIGRETEVEAACALLLDDGVRLLTLTGPGGVGKTRLALRVGETVATTFEDGVGFVPLAAVTDPGLVLPSIARGLGVREAGRRAPRALLRDYLGHRHFLLLLDNFEQVRSAGIDLVELLSACPGLVLLITSRAMLHVAGEQRFPVAPLAVPEAGGGRQRVGGARREAEASAAVQLFVARARAVEPGFSLTAANHAAVAEICRRLDGLPLAIELAAARTQTLSPIELLSRLAPALPLLADGPIDAPDRLRTMQHAIAWSYDLLGPAEQTLFCRLAIFIGGFSLEAAERVAGVAEDGSALDVLSLLTSLVDMSLVLRSEGEDRTRFGMLETVREFALERLVDSGEAEVIAARHAAWCVNLADGVRQTGRLSQRQGLDTLDVEHPNLQAALDWLLQRGETTTAMHLAGQLAEFWLRRSHLAEGIPWLERILAADNGAPTAARAEALVGLNMLLWPLDEWARVERLLAEAEAVARTAGDAAALAYARLHQGYIALFRGDLDLAVARGEECLSTALAIPQGFNRNGPLWLLARTALARGEHERASELYALLLDAARAGPDEMSLANALYGQAILAERRGELGLALSGIAAAAAAAQAFGDRLFLSECLDEAAALALALGQPEPGVRFFAAADTLRAPVGVLPAVLQSGWHGPERALPAREALGEERFVAVWAAGATASLDAAIAEISALARQTATSTRACHPDGGDALTAREREIVSYLVEGRSDKEIAAALGVSRRTVSNHVSGILAKLDAPSRAAVAAIAVRDGLV